MEEYTSVSLQEMLAAREERVTRQNKLLEIHHLPLISFTLNIPGPEKRYSLADSAFVEGKRRIFCTLHTLNLRSVAIEEYSEKTGCLLLVAVDSTAQRIKQEMVLLEDADDLARIFDIDVLSSNGDKLSRTQLALPERKCFLCSNQAQLCARSRTHSVEELKQYIDKVILNFCSNTIIEKYSAAAMRALLYEVTVAPKPGLVDRIDNGAHRDMDIFTFIDSTSSLVPYFRDAVSIGLSFNGNFEETFHKLRSRGRLAEEEMLFATDGVNTHKGMIFSMGILCCACGVLHATGKKITATNVTKQSRILATDTIKKDLQQMATGQTTGEKLYLEHNISGIRGEVLGGFPTVMKYGLPMLRRQLRMEASLNDAAVVTLLSILSQLTDTNIIHRSSMADLASIQNLLRSAIRSQNTQQLIKTATQLNIEWKMRNISPGGSADLLAVTLFLHFIEE